DPLSLLAIVYGWGTPQLNFIRIVEHLSELLVAIGLPVSVHRGDEGLTREYSEIPVNPLMGSDLFLRIPFYYAVVEGEPAEFSFAVRELLASAGKLPGLTIEPDVPSSLPLNFPLGTNTDLLIRAGSDIASHFGIVVRPDEIRIKYPFQSNQEMPKAGFGLALDYHPNNATLHLRANDETRQ